MRGRYLVVGAMLVLLAVVGFALPSPLFGAIATTPAINVVHLLSGMYVIVAAGRGLGAMRSAGKLVGFLSVTLAVVAFAVDHATVTSFVPAHDANGWLHLGLGLFFLYHALLAPPQ